MDLTSDQYQAIIAWAQRTPQIRAAILFGSRAKGTSRPDSDVDVALELNAPTSQEVMAMFIKYGESWQTELRRDTALLVNIDFLDQSAPNIASYVAAAGIELFRR